MKKILFLIVALGALFGLIACQNVEKTIESITISSNPTKVQYEIGEDLDLSGLVVTVQYSDDTELTITSDDFTVSGFDNTVASEQTITVTYGDYSATFIVTVIESQEASLREQLLEGIWETEIDGGTRGMLTMFLSFHDDGIFYHSKFEGGMYDAGYWELVEEDLAFTDETGETSIERTAPAYIRLTNIDGSPYTNDQGESTYAIYEDSIYRMTWGDVKYDHNADSDHEISSESPVLLLSYADPTNSFSNVSIYHNGNFEDTISFLDGTWSYDDSSRTYTLTDGDDVATLVVSLDGRTAAYSYDSTSLTLDNTEEILETVYRFSYYEDVEGVPTEKGFIALYEDGSLELILTVAAGTGEWEFNEITKEFTITIGGVPVTVTKDGSSYSLDVETGGVTRTYELVLEGELQVQFEGTFMVNEMFPGTTVIQLFDDGSATFHTQIDMTAAAMGIVEKDEVGTWSLNTTTYEFTITLDETREYVVGPGTEALYPFTYSFDMQGSTGTVTYNVDVAKVSLEPELQVQFEGTFMVNEMFPGTTVIQLFDDGSATFHTEIDMTAAAMGIVEKDEVGTWSLNTTTYEFTITLDETREYIVGPGTEALYPFTYSFDMQGSTGTVTYNVDVVKVELS